MHVGKGGIDDGLIGAVNQALLDHELIKVKVGESAGLDRQEVANAIAAKTQSDIAQVLGNIVILYKAHPEKPEIELPRGSASGAKGDDDEAEGLDDE